MKDIYYESLALIEQGYTFKINFKKRELTIDDTKVIVNGKFGGDLGVDAIEDKTELFDIFNRRFELYYRSIPSEKSDKNRKPRFCAARLDELTQEDFLGGVPREVARFSLEYFILASLINGSFVPEEDIKGWFYQGTNKNFIILKEWF